MFKFVSVSHECARPRNIPSNALFGHCLNSQYISVGSLYRKGSYICIIDAANVANIFQNM